MNVKVLRGIEDLEKGLFGKSSRLGRLERNHLFFSKNWLLTWYSKMGANRRILAIFITDSHDTIKLFLPFVEVPGVGGKGLWPMSYHTGDLFDPYLFSEESEELLELSFRELLKDYVFVWLPLLSPKITNALEGALTKFKNFHIIRDGSTRSFINLRGDFSKRFQQRLENKKNRYQERKLEEMGKLRIEDFNTSESIKKIFHRLDSIEVSSWKNDAGVGLFSLPGVATFYGDLLPQLAQDALVNVSVLFIDDVAVAYEIGLLSGKSYGMHNLAYNEQYAKWSPGRYLMHRNIRKAIEKGYEVFDFMQGVQPYKKGLLTGKEILSEANIFQRSLKGYINYRLVRFVQNLKKKKAKKAEEVNES